MFVCVDAQRHVGAVRPAIARPGRAQTSQQPTSAGNIAAAVAAGSGSSTMAGATRKRQRERVRAAKRVFKVLRQYGEENGDVQWFAAIDLPDGTIMSDGG